jgi:subtilase family serine protease
MFKILSYRKLISFFVPLIFTLQAIAHNPHVPLLPKGSIPRPPYILKSPHGTLTPSGYSPAQIQQAYGFLGASQGAGETIAIIDAGDDPNIEADLNTFSTQFGLPACTTANGCFSKVFSDGSLPPGDPGWAVETSLDVEWAHAIAPQAKILLVESTDASSLYWGIPFAIQQGASVISMSWGGGEFNTETSYDSFFFQNGTANIPMFAAAGDSGTGVWYPASSPYVTGVGGTQLGVDSNNNWSTEIAWSGSGGGVSAYETEPAFQKSYVIPSATTGMRGVPDVTYNGSGGSPYAVYDSYQQGGWLQVAGTSAGTPQWAALAADMMSTKNGKFNNFNASIYSVAREYSLALLHDITTGTNGTCGYYCTARSGFDYVSGVGSPQAGDLMNRFK